MRRGKKAAYFTHCRGVTSRAGKAHPRQLPGLYGNFVVHIIHTSAIRRRRRRRRVPGVVGRALSIDYFHAVCHLEGPHERHGPPAIVVRRWQWHEWMRGENLDTTRRMIITSWLSRARRIGAIEIRHGRRVVLPHVDASLGRAREFADVANGVVGAVGKLVVLRDELAFREEAPLGAVVLRPVEVVLALGGDVAKVRPAALRRRSWRPVTQTTCLEERGANQAARDNRQCALQINCHALGSWGTRQISLLPFSYPSLIAGASRRSCL